MVARGTVRLCLCARPGKRAASPKDYWRHVTVSIPPTPEERRARPHMRRR